MLPTIDKINTWLTHYVHSSGDDQETLLQKKIWWLIHCFGFFLLILATFLIKIEFTPAVDLMNLLFLIGLILGPLIFHFYKKKIERYALFSQIGVVLICAAKVYLEGGLLYAGAPIFIGLIAPVYALTMPNKKRAVIILLLYIFLMIGGTLLQPENPDKNLVSYYFIGFLIGVIQIFATLYYYTVQVEKLKRDEKQRMKELDDFKTKFYTNITHEFRTPLTIILGMTDQIKTSPKEWLEEGLTMIKRNGRKLLNLTNQLLDLSKLEANAMPVNLVQDDIAVYLKYLVESFHSLAGSKGIRLAFFVEPEKILMDFDPDKIQDIVSNLLSNAIQFTTKDGLIQVSASLDESNTKKKLILTIKDTGTGIPEEHIPKIFDRYFQAENQKEHLTEGTGLGLSLTKELIILLNGDITVESNFGQGSTFIVRLPITNQVTNSPVFLSKEKLLSKLAYEENYNIPILPEKEGKEKLVLLLVEDNNDVVRYLYSLLSSHYQVEVAANGLEGFEKSISIVPDLIISDVMMPLMDGFEFCKQLKRDLRTSHIPVIMLTARVDANSKVEGLMAGADVYLAKPFNREELFVRIKKLIELRRALQNRYKANPLLSGKQLLNNNTPFEKEDAFIKKVHHILKGHLSDEEFGITELGRSLGMSRSQLYRKFSALTNTSVHHFIRKLRLVQARELLLTTDLNVTEVALETGFKNLSHFSKVFSEEFGVAPSKVKP
jgi:signal transduction histidine kinase/DNA-binding response OmpR family regulator